MKKIIYVTLLLIPLLYLSSCNGSEAKAKNRAEDLCDCLQDIGFNKQLSLKDIQDREFQREFERNAEEHLPPCMLKVFRSIEKDIDHMSKKEKKAYTKTFLKSCIDTECSDIVLDNIPYDMMGYALNEAEEIIERKEKYRQEYDRY